MITPPRTPQARVEIVLRNAAGAAWLDEVELEASEPEVSTRLVLEAHMDTTAQVSSGLFHRERCSSDATQLVL